MNTDEIRELNCSEKNKKEQNNFGLRILGTAPQVAKGRRLETAAMEGTKSACADWQYGEAGR
jgi:hypothetical protein